MAMIAKSSGGEFEIAPEGTGLGVCVDVTPLKTRQTQWGEKREFRFVFELDESAFGVRKDGSRYCIWSRGFSLNITSVPKKSNLTKFLESWMGAELTKEDYKNGVDVEELLGVSAKIIVQHDNGYANILSIRPSGEAQLMPSGKFVRECDRRATAKDHSAGAGTGSDGAKAAFRGADKPEGCGREDWQKTKVCVGKYAGTDLGDLSTEAFDALHDKWLPKALEAEKLSADEKRLVAALQAGKAARETTTAEEEY